MILIWDKDIKLCLESFHSSNLTHFHLEQTIKSELNRENQTRTEQYVNGTTRAKILISLIPYGWHLNIRLLNGKDNDAYTAKC